MQNVTQKRQENVEKKSKLKSTNKKNLVPFADGVLNEMPSRGVMKDIPNYSGVKSSNSMGSTSSGDQSKYSSNSHISSNSTNKRSIISISARYPHFDNCTFDENKLSVGHIREGYQCDKSHYENLPSSLSHKSHSNITDYFDKIVKGGISSNNKFNCTNNRQSQGNARPTDNIWLVTPRTKTLTEQWFRDLSDGKELRLLRKRIPIFNKVDELFITLYENRILASRAVWLLKVTHQYSEKSDSGKSKKRQSYLLNDVVGIFSNNLFCSDYKSNGFFHYILDILDALHSNAMINDLDFLKLIIDMIQNRKFNTNVSMILRITIIISKSVAIISKHYHLYINVFIYFMKALRSNHWLKMSEK
ncbi:MAG: Mediator of RNA polymerase II transcription subunit 12, partial [Marteilia pararefringens]